MDDVSKRPPITSRRFIRIAKRDHAKHLDFVWHSKQLFDGLLKWRSDDPHPTSAEAQGMCGQQKILDGHCGVSMIENRRFAWMREKRYYNWTICHESSPSVYLGEASSRVFILDDYGAPWLSVVRRWCPPCGLQTLSNLVIFDLHAIVSSDTSSRLDCFQHIHRMTPSDTRCSPSQTARLFEYSTNVIQDDTSRCQNSGWFGSPNRPIHVLTHEIARGRILH